MSEPTPDPAGPEASEEAESAPRRASLPRRLLFATVRGLAALAVALVLVEITMRVAGLGVPPRGPNNRLPLRRAVAHEVAPYLKEELIPGAVGEVVYPAWDDEPERVIRYEINASGFRDHETPLERRPDTFRIACLGDSVTYGTGVQVDETWPKQLERMFAEELGEGRVEVFNCGMYSCNTRQQVAFLKHRVLPFEPDLVFIATTVTDASGEGLEDGVLDSWESAWINRLGLTSGVWDEGDDVQAPPQVKRMLALRRTSRLVDTLAHKTYAWLLTRIQKDGYARDWDEGSPGRTLVTTAIQHASRVAEEEGFALWVAMYPTLTTLNDDYPYLEQTEILRGIAEGAGAGFTDLFPAFRGMDAKRLHAHAHDRHPNPYAHGVAAHALLGELLPVVREALGEPAGS